MHKCFAGALKLALAIGLLSVCAGVSHAASTILVATPLGPVKSTDGGTTWSVIPVNVNSGLLSGQPQMTAVAFDPKTPSTWYATGTPNGAWGFYKSLDSGKTWTASPLLNFVPDGSIIVDPVATNTIYMKASAGSSFFIVKTTDSGATWSILKIPNTVNAPADKFPGGSPPFFISTDPQISGVIYVISADLFKSVDFGATWSILTTVVDPRVSFTFPQLKWIDIDPRDSQVLYASANAQGPRIESSFCKSAPGAGECGLYKSVDGGKTWSELNIQTPQTFSLSFDPASGAIYVGAELAATGSTISKSTDGGATWTPLKLFGGNAPVVHVDPSTPSTVYGFEQLGNIPGYFDRSTDGGATWVTISTPRLCPLSNPKCQTSLSPKFDDLVIVPATGSGASGPPAISANGVVNGASLQPGFAANSWTTVFGTNLASTTDTWSSFIVNGKLPTVVDGVSVTMGGKPAYVYFISLGQINVLAPDVAPGPVSVTVTTAAGTSSTFTVTASLYGPAFFLWPGNQPVATRQDYSYAAKAGTFAGAATTPAKPGEVLILWATGLGPTVPAAPGGVAVPGGQTYSTATLPTVAINNTSATVYGTALAPGAAGLYQIAIQVPTTLADGDWPIVASIGGVQSPVGTLLTVHH